MTPARRAEVQARRDLAAVQGLTVGEHVVFMLNVDVSNPEADRRQRHGADPRDVVEHLLVSHELKWDRLEALLRVLRVLRERGDES